MSTYYYAQNNDGDYLFDNFPSHLKYLISNYTETSSPIEVIENGKKIHARIGRKSNNVGVVYTLTVDPKFINRHKLFKELVDLSLLTLNPIDSLRKEIVQEQSKRTEEFIHNITSLNSYSIQDLFSLIPQDTLTKNINKQDEIVKSVLSEKPNVSATTLLKLIKYNLAMKVEFSVFERTQKSSSYVQKLSHSIRSIVLSVLQIFIEDFEKNRIEVSVDAGEASERRIEVDYDSLFVSLFYLLDNSIKYCCSNTKYKIIFKEDENCYSILFIMISIKINKNEVEKLKVNGYRSDLARKIHDKGNGIGMYRIQKTLQLNNAELEITPRINDYSRKVSEIEYEANQFKITFRGQKKWL